MRDYSLTIFFQRKGGIMITENEFRAYERVRVSGKTNMLDVSYVSVLSGLDRDKIKEIIKTYEELMKKYPKVRK